MADRRETTPNTAVRAHGSYAVTRRNRHWEVRDPTGELVCLTVYKRGANEVVRRMTLSQAAIGSTTAR
jgi:hypothetical protein